MIILAPFRVPPTRRENLDHLVSSISLLKSGFKISMKNIMQEDQNDQMYDFGLKIVIFDPFLTLPL